MPSINLKNAVPNNANILTDVYGGNIDSAKQYMANMAKEIDPSVTSGTQKLGNKSMSKLNELKYQKMLKTNWKWHSPKGVLEKKMRLLLMSGNLVLVKVLFEEKILKEFQLKLMSSF